MEVKELKESALLKQWMVQFQLIFLKRLSINALRT